MNASPDRSGGSANLPAGFRLFLREFFKGMRSTASVAPSSRYLSHAMIEPLDFARVRVLVELGPGTGAVTREILKRLRTDATLYAFETNPRFIDHLIETCSDKRLVPVHAGAENIIAELQARGVNGADAVVSSLGLTSMPQGLRESIVQQARSCLRAGGVLTQYQYSMALPGYRRLHAAVHKFDERSFFESHFRTVSAQYVLLNVPPACVFTCRD